MCKAHAKVRERLAFYESVRLHVPGLQKSQLAVYGK